jgi:hypothetical protein
MASIKVACPVCFKLVRRGGLMRHKNQSPNCRTSNDNDEESADMTVGSELPRLDNDFGDYDDTSWMGMTSDPIPMETDECDFIGSPASLVLPTHVITGQPEAEIGRMHKIYTVPYFGAGAFLYIPTFDSQFLFLTP